VLTDGLTLVAAFCAIAFVGPYEPAAAVTALAILQADVPEAAFHGLRDHFRRLFFRAPRDVVVARHRVVRASAQHLVYGHAGAFSLDVPQGFVHSADHLVVHRSAAPVRAEVRALPEILDAVRVLADQPRLEMLFQSGCHGERLVAVVCGADAVQSWLAGNDLHEDPAIIAAAA